MKQVIVIRKDLNMRKGKMCAQAAHASMKVFFDRLYSTDKGWAFDSISEAADVWIKGNFKKIVLYVNSEAELLDLFKKVDGVLPCSLILDAGLTEFKEPTHTCIAIGPDTNENIDVFTSHLLLL